MSMRAEPGRPARVLDGDPAAASAYLTNAPTSCHDRAGGGGLMEFRASVLLSLQGALWDRVGPNLRGVTATFDHPVVTARFLFENDPTEEDREDVSLAESQVVADFLDDVAVDFTPVWAPVSQPRDLLPGEHWVFLRKEP